MTYALADEHRRHAFHRHVLAGELEWTLTARPRHRWTIGITNGLVFQDGYFAGDRFFLNLGFVFDPGRGMEHFAPQQRLYRNEIGERWWFDPQDPWSE